MESDTVAWDQAEPEDLLFWVERALHRYIEHHACEECLGLAREGLGRLRPGLEAAGQHDAIPLCEEMFRVTTALDEGQLPWSPEASALLARAARRLPGAAQPAGSAPEDEALLPLVNELRSLRGVGPLMMPAIVMAEGSAAAPGRNAEARGRVLGDHHPVAPEPKADEESGGRGKLRRETRPPTPAPVAESGPAIGTASADAGAGGSGGPVPSRLVHDRDLLECAVLAPHLDRAPARLPEVLATAVRGLGKAFERWREEDASAEGARALGDRLRILRNMARPVALRFGEFAGVMESLAVELADRGHPAGREALQVIADAIEVMPLLLDEVRAGGPADTPLADIVLRAEAVVSEEPQAGQGELSPSSSGDLPGLEEIRSRGRAEMARLAAAFEALEAGAGPAGPAEERPRALSPEPAPAGLGAALTQAAELADWQHRVVDALTRIADQAQALEALAGRLHAPAAAAGGSNAGTGVALDELQQLRHALGEAVGDASAAVLRQQRLTRMLQDSLEGCVRQEAGGD